MDFDTRVGCYGWIERNAEVLLAHWATKTDDGREVSGWTLPGGGVESGETPEQAALREIHEETGYDVRLGQLLGVRNHWVTAERRFHGQGVPLQILQVVYRAEVTRGDLRVEVDGSTDDVAWVKVNDVPSLDGGGSGIDVVGLVRYARSWVSAGSRQRPADQVSDLNVPRPASH